MGAQRSHFDTWSPAARDLPDLDGDWSFGLERYRAELWASTTRALQVLRASALYRDATVGVRVGQSGRVARPALEPGEHELARYWANRVQGNRAVGGRLVLTNRRVMFSPHWIDRSTGGRAWEVELPAVSHVGVASRGAEPTGRYTGSARRRLQIVCANTTETFVVNRVDAVAAAISAARSG